MSTSTIKRTPNHSAWRYVDSLVEFSGSNLRGEAYSPGGAPHLSDRDSWLSAFETEHYGRNRPHIVYIVWSFYTPIAYFTEVNGKGRWYLVGQTFSSFTSRHKNGALRNVHGHTVTIHGTRGDWTVTCHEPHCWGERHFTDKREAERAYFNHRA